MASEVFYDSANELATLTNTFKVSGVATDPTTISLVVSAPDGTSTTYTSFTHTNGTGIYVKDIPCTVPGEWVGVWTGTGAASDVTVVRWTVFDTDAVLYCSPEAVEARFGITDTDDRSHIEGAIRAVSEWIDNWTGDFFGRVEDIRTFEASGGYDLETGSIVSVDTLATDLGDGTYSVPWGATDYQLLPVNRSNGRETRPYTSLRAVGSLTFPYGYSYGRTDLVQIEGVFGWPQVPAGVREAALILSGELLKLKDAPFGVAGFAEYGAVRIKDNPKALSLLEPYKPPAVG